MATSKEKVLSILLMRYKIQPAKGYLLSEEWFKQHPQTNWETLENFLKQDKVIVVKGMLKESQPKNPDQSKSVRKYRGAEIVSETPQNPSDDDSLGKERRYRGAKY
jgi:hypothetical protein